MTDKIINFVYNITTMSSEQLTKLGKSNFKILINSIYGTAPIGSDRYKMFRIYTRKQKIKTIIND